jgi:hypothetical protein
MRDTWRETHTPNYAGMQTGLDLEPPDGFSYTTIYGVSIGDMPSIPGSSEEPLRWYVKVK